MCSAQKALEKRIAKLVFARVRLASGELLDLAEETHCVQELSKEALEDPIISGVGY